jgi:nucleotide-binding universal stress UspA family protein
MAYKTILVHLNDARRAGPLIDAARLVGEQNEAHLIGVYAVPTITMGAPTRIGAGVIEVVRRRFHDEAESLRAKFLEAMRGRAVTTEWRMLETRSGVRDCGALVAYQARTADLIIAAQTDPTWDDSGMLDFPDRLALESGRPALIIPNAGKFPTIGSRVLVAWNGSRESVRAVFDALPLLTRAKSVVLLTVAKTRIADEDLDTVPAADIATALSRHGVKCELQRSVAAGIEIEEELLSRAADASADLIVMGCYGHSRLRELVMGGASRGVLSHMTAPVLMAH